MGAALLAPHQAEAATQEPSTATTAAPVTQTQVEAGEVRPLREVRPPLDRAALAAPALSSCPSQRPTPQLFRAV